MLTQEEFKNELNAILDNLGDPGKISEILLKINDDYATSFETYTETLTANTELSETNASLVKSNGELFRQVGLTKEETVTEEPEETKDPLENLAPIEDVMENLLPTWGEK